MNVHTPPRDIEIWYDGQCALCRNARSACRRLDDRGSLVFTDFRKGEQHDLPLNRRAHERTLWVRTAEGDLIEGFDAWRQILFSLPKWRWLARATGIPPIPVLGRIAYRAVARIRRLWMSPPQDDEQSSSRRIQV